MSQLINSITMSKFTDRRVAINKIARIKCRQINTDDEIQTHVALLNAWHITVTPWLSFGTGALKFLGFKKSLLNSF